MTSPSVVFDHIAVGASDLEAGRAWARETCGIDIPDGGRHPRMGTHNLLTRLSPTTFFEIIAVDPGHPGPARPRWFGLDQPGTRAALAQGPCLLAWLVGTTDIDATLQSARTCRADLGVALAMSRGDLHWRFAVRPDGSIPVGGVLPIPLEWPQGMAHPAAGMADCGVRFEGLELVHPQPDDMNAALSAMGAGDITTVRQAAGAAVTVQLRRPDGIEVRLRTPSE